MPYKDFVMDKINRIFYGCHAHTVLVMNTSITSMWLSVFLLEIFNVVNIELPVGAYDHMVILLILTVSSLLCSVFNYTCKFKESHKIAILKSNSLALGGIIQGVLSIRYYQEYPPLDVSSVFCLVMSFWFLGGALYVSNQKESQHDTVNYRH